MKIAIVGTGVSGMLAAHLLHKDHDLTVFEADDRIGGHSNTVEVELGGRTYPVDTGFIVYNDWTYPNFIRLLDRLGVENQTTEMSFSVRCDRTGLEYAGSSIDTLFAQRANVVRLSFYRMLLDIVRFNRHAKSFLRREDFQTTMSQFIAAQRYSTPFVEQYILPMMAAIWSAKPFDIQDFPARHFLRFFENHGLLNLKDRPRWRTVKGGSKSYVEPLTRPFRDRIRTSSPVDSIHRDRDGVTVSARGGEAERFDQVVIAAHSDQALCMLQDPSPAEREILGAIGYQENEAILHTDASVLPRSRRAWASWNYHIPEAGSNRVALTYHMNTLQGLDAPEEFCVTLNQDTMIDPGKIIRRIMYHHPVFDTPAIEAQHRHGEISGFATRTHYCGAYWGYGFHEDGVNSALRVAAAFGRGL